MKFRPANVIWFFLLFTVVNVTLFWPGYTLQFTLGGDALDLILPSLSHLRGSLLQGEWPFWNPYQYQGLDTTLFPVYWNPIYLLLSILFADPASALNALYFSLLFLGGFGFFKFSSLFVDEEKTAMLGGLAYPLIGIFVGMGTRLGIIALASFIPLLLYTNHRYLLSNKTTWVVFLGLGYFMLSTMTSMGFLIIAGLALLIQSWYYPGLRRMHRIYTLSGTLVIAGMMIGKIYTERSRVGHQVTDGLGSHHSSPLHALHDLISFVLPEFRILSADYLTTFPHYLGFLVLVFAIVALFYDTSKMDRNLGFTSLIGIILGIIVAQWEWTRSAFSGFTGSGLSTAFKLTATISIVLLGLRGLEKSQSVPKNVRYIFLALSLTGASLAIYLQKNPNTGIELEIEIWKIAFFSILTGLSFWLKNIHVRWALVAVLILTDLGITNHFLQEYTLWHDHPSTSWRSTIIHPETKKPPLDLIQSSGQLRDEDLAFGGLNRNTGTLIRQMVRDGYWPWPPDSSFLTSANDTSNDYRFPIWYFSRDTLRKALPTTADFNSHIGINSYGNTSWNLTIDHQFERYLVFNQNFHPQWFAALDGERVPIEATQTGKMMIPVKSGKHNVQFWFRPDGIHHLFLCMMAAFGIAILFLLIRKSFPVPILGGFIPVVIIFLMSGSNCLPDSSAPTDGITEMWDYSMTYEKMSSEWFLRGEQLTIADSRNGYRAERMGSLAHYSATLQLDPDELKDFSTLVYRFHIKASDSIKLAVVFKTYIQDEETHNIAYLQSLDNQNWTMLEGSFSIPKEMCPVKMAEWYIWNYENEDFLIDDIEIKLNP